MTGLQGDGTGVALGSPVKKGRLSLRIFHKKETTRALDFSENHEEESVSTVTEEPASCDQMVPGACLPTPLACLRRDSLAPFVGFSNLGNTCYLNSILQVLYYCPGFKDAIQTLYQLSKTADAHRNSETENEESELSAEESASARMELLGSFHSLFTSVEHSQASFLLNPEKYTNRELATPPCRLLNTLRQLNPMYEGHLQHDAQEVLQCILTYIQEVCNIIQKKQRGNHDDTGEKRMECGSGAAPKNGSTGQTETQREEEAEVDEQLSGKRKSDTEAGNIQKKSKSQTKSNKCDSKEESQHFTRSKRKSSSDLTVVGTGSKWTGEGGEEKAEKAENENVGSCLAVEKNECALKEGAQRKKTAKLSWLNPLRKQPSIFSKFRSVGRISTRTGGRGEGREASGKESSVKETQEQDNTDFDRNVTTLGSHEHQKTAKPKGQQSLDELKQLFRGQLVLRTRCLECECYTERREDFQDISVPVQEDERSSTDLGSEVSPEPKAELKTLRWAISQFASVERIVGQEKYFCETCCHYTEAERSLQFDTVPEVITIHLKCFSASNSETEPYAGLSKVSTPLQTPLRLSLKEWCAQPCRADGGGLHYMLFAVVMHSGVSISSGHYTTYIRMTDLQRPTVWPLSPEENTEEGVKMKEEVFPDYDDGEVSFSLRRRVMQNGGANVSSAASKAGAKRPSEGVGLLGGQRNLPSYQLGTDQQNSLEKSTASTPWLSSAALQDGGVMEGTEAVRERSQETLDTAWQKVLDYEGKWLLFDDSEVKLVQEEDFLRSCSPHTSSTSTPYLLFYKKLSH
ncbi:LOW QUALITY PROTEIN: ubiquitin carboxyl-terminal hydrolase 1 [Chanos chanos]|uniref:Ubiquitin carboxyl-terminal hydrolase n=1 Tax=Chanos chanos TaxID=29144 RepID=A0A6J2WS14_CHACN|nr:LOW QUALITY PROTEIN: ubiquitin carboxyl-terminal hydrolase 1 [Chanos chanos]